MTYNNLIGLTNLSESTKPQTSSENIEAYTQSYRCSRAGKKGFYLKSVTKKKKKLTPATPTHECVKHCAKIKNNQKFC